MGVTQSLDKPFNCATVVVSKQIIPMRNMQNIGENTKRKLR